MTTALADRIPNDPGLPGLAQLFDPAEAPSIAAEMAQRLTGTRVTAETGDLVYVRYKPGKDCVTQWAFPASSGQPVLVSAKLLSNGKGADLISQPIFQDLAESVRSRAGWKTEPFRYLHDRQMLFQLFPMDFKLAGLPLAMSDSWAAVVFASALDLSPGAVCVTDIKRVAYNPWNRCVLRYTFEANGRRAHYFAKLFRDDRGQRMFPILQALTAKLGASGASWCIPAPVAFVPEGRMLVLEGLKSAGDARSLLKQAISDERAKGALKDAFSRAAEGIVEFQRIAVEGLPVTTPQSLLQWHHRRVNVVSRAAPVVARSLMTELSSLEKQASCLPTERLVLAHGAFRHTHLLLCDGRLGLVDLDNLGISGASADAGDFLAYLDRTALHRPDLKPVIRELEEIFVAGLRTNPAVDPRWVAWYRAVAHVKWTMRSVHSLSVKSEWASEGLLPLYAEARSC